MKVNVLNFCLIIHFNVYKHSHSISWSAQHTIIIVNIAKMFLFLQKLQLCSKMFSINDYPNQLSIYFILK